MADEKENFEFLLSQFLDGQLSPSESAGLRKQIQKDPSLSQQLRQYQALDKHLSELAVPELADLDYEAQRWAIMSSLERKVLLEQRRPKIILLRPAFWGAAAAAATIVLTVSLAWKALFPGEQNVPARSAEQVAVRLLPESPVGQGQAVVKVSAARIAEPESPLPPRPLPSLEQAPPGTVMVSIMPRGESQDLPDASPGEIDFPI